MPLTYVMSGVASTTATTAPGAEITFDGGTPPRIAGPQQDPADLYGIVLVILAIAVALIATRWLFGRRGRPPGQ